MEEVFVSGGSECLRVVYSPMSRVAVFCYGDGILRAVGHAITDVDDGRPAARLWETRCDLPWSPMLCRTRRCGIYTAQHILFPPPRVPSTETFPDNPSATDTLCHPEQSNSQANVHLHHHPLAPLPAHPPHDPRALPVLPLLLLNTRPPQGRKVPRANKDLHHGAGPLPGVSSRTPTAGSLESAHPALIDR